MVTRIAHVDDSVVVAAAQGDIRKVVTKWGLEKVEVWLREEKEEENHRGRDAE